MCNKSVKDILVENNFRFNKKYGQNFLSDTNLLRAIVEDAQISSQDTVLEIGAGAGALTRYIAQVAKKVISYEIDNNLRPVLDTTLSDYNNVEIVYLDFMNESVENITKLLGEDFKVVANLPYYITTPIIMKLIENGLGKSITIMVQEEVALRLIAKAGSKDYGAITAQISLVAEVELLRKVSRQMFFPPPNVDSAIIKITPQKKYAGINKDTTKHIIKAAFAMRRKTLLNNLINAFALTREQAEDMIKHACLPQNIRGEMLSVDNFVTLSDYYSKEVKNENIN